MAVGLGSVSSLGIGLAVYMDDQFSGVQRTVSNSLAVLGRDVDDFNQSMARMESLGSGIAAVGDAILKGAAAGVTEFAKFEDVMNSVKSIAQLGEDPAGLKALTDQALKLGNVYGQLPKDIAGAQLELSKAGKSRQEIEAMTEAVMVLGSAAETAVAGKNGAAEILVNIMQQYNAGAKEAMYYADVITSAANQSTIDVTDFYESMKYSGDVARSLGIPVKDAAAAIATLGNAGLKGSSGGTAYANMLRYIAKSLGEFGSDKQKEALDILGIGPKDLVTAEGNLVNLQQMMQVFRRQTEGMTNMRKLDVFQAIFGVRGDRAMQPLLTGMVENAQGNMVPALAEMARKIENDIRIGIAKKTAEEKLDDMMGDWQKFMAGWSAFKIGIGASLAPMIRPLLQMLTGLMSKITQLANSEFGQWLIRSGVVMGLAASMIGRLIIGGARLMGYIMTSAGTMRSTFTMAQMSANAIRTQFQIGANAIVAAMLRARGLSVGMMGTTPMLRNTATGRLVGRSTGVTRTLALLFGGRTAITIANWFSRMVATLGPVVGWLSKAGIFLKGLGAILGRVLGWLFGWEALLVDLISTLVTGKGLFEWLWEGLKWLGGLFGIGGGSGDEPKKLEKYDAKRDYEREEALVTDGTHKGPKSWNQEMMDKLNRQRNNQTIHVTVNPTTGDERTERTININQQRALQSNAIQ